MPARHIAQDDQRLRALVGLDLQDVQARLQSGQGEQTDCEDDHGDEHLHQGGAALRCGALAFIVTTCRRVLTPSLLRVRLPSPTCPPMAVKVI